MEATSNTNTKSNFNQIPLHVRLIIVKSGIIKGGTMMTLQDCDISKRIIRSDIQTSNKHQTVFAHTRFGPSKVKRFSVVLVSAEDVVYWFEQGLFLFKLNVPDDNAWTEVYTFVQHFDITIPIDEIDNVLNCVCLRWATRDEFGYTINFKSSSQNKVEIGEWYGLVPLASVILGFHIFQSNYAVQPFLPYTPWPAPRFYVNQFYQGRN